MGAHGSVLTPSGDTLAAEPSMLYLGATVHTDGKFGCEVSRKLGMASAEFKALHRLWRNSLLSVTRKIRLFEALIVSKLSYGVASAWLSKADLRRMDGFHSSCLRKILRIPPSFISRVSNERVRKMAKQGPLSALIRSSQLRLLDQVLMNPAKADNVLEEHDDTDDRRLRSKDWQAKRQLNRSDAEDKNESIRH